jgi:hypothetical protein
MTMKGLRALPYDQWAFAHPFLGGLPIDMVLSLCSPFEELWANPCLGD